MEVDTLSNFAFDLFDIDLPHGELSFPDIERMMIELFGEDGIKTGTGKTAMDDITLYAEERGGRLQRADFTIYVHTHELILLPIFTMQKTIQRHVMGNRFWRKVERKRSKTIQRHVMGNRFWRKVERKRSNHAVGESVNDGLDPKKVQFLLRTHKSRAPAVLLGHVGGDGKGFAGALDEERTAQQHTNGSDTRKRPSKWAGMRESIRGGRYSSSASSALDAFAASGRRATERVVDRIERISVSWTRH
jgi:hypothetical protein